MTSINRDKCKRFCCKVCDLPLLLFRKFKDIIFYAIKILILNTLYDFSEKDKFFENEISELQASRSSRKIDYSTTYLTGYQDNKGRQAENLGFLTMRNALMQLTLKDVSIDTSLLLVFCANCFSPDTIIDHFSDIKAVLLTDSDLMFSKVQCIPFGGSLNNNLSIYLFIEKISQEIEAEEKDPGSQLFLRKNVITLLSVISKNKLILLLEREDIFDSLNTCKDVMNEKNNCDFKFFIKNRVLNCNEKIKATLSANASLSPLNKMIFALHEEGIPKEVILPYAENVIKRRKFNKDRKERFTVIIASIFKIFPKSFYSNTKNIDFKHEFMKVKLANNFDPMIRKEEAQLNEDAQEILKILHDASDDMICDITTKDFRTDDYEKFQEMTHGFLFKKMHMQNAVDILKKRLKIFHKEIPDLSYLLFTGVNNLAINCCFLDSQVDSSSYYVASKGDAVPSNVISKVLDVLLPNKHDTIRMCWGIMGQGLLYFIPNVTKVKSVKTSTSVRKLKYKEGMLRMIGASSVGDISGFLNQYIDSQNQIKKSMIRQVLSTEDIEIIASNMWSIIFAMFSKGIQIK